MVSLSFYLAMRTWLAYNYLANLLAGPAGTPTQRAAWAKLFSDNFISQSIPDEEMRVLTPVAHTKNRDDAVFVDKFNACLAVLANEGPGLASGACR